MLKLSVPERTTSNTAQIIRESLRQQFQSSPRGYRSSPIWKRLQSHRLRCWQHRLQGGAATYNASSNLLASDQAVIQQLHQQGAIQTSLNALALPLNQPLMKAAEALAAQLPNSLNSTGHLGHCIHGDAATILQDYPEIFLWGLQDRLLDIVENYVQLPVAYLGVDLRKDIPDGRQIGTRFWHTDGEDTSVVKVAVYLSDVEQEHGPFEYISKTQFNTAYRYLSPKFVMKNLRQPPLDDQHMGRIVPPQRWTSCTGKKGTAIIVDTASVFHHGAIPTQERIALFFAYATQAPKNLSFCKEYFPVEHLLLDLKDRLPKRQWECLWAWRQADPQHCLAAQSTTENTGTDLHDPSASLAELAS